MRLFKKKPKIDWNLDYEFMKWLNKWAKEYRKNASKIVDLTYKTYRYKGKKYNQLEIINRIIDLTDKLIDEDYYYYGEDMKKVYDECMEVLDLFKKVYWDMWW